MSTKKLERPIGKLRSMHLAIPGAMGHFYHLQMALTAASQASCATAYLSKGFNRGVPFWQSLCVDMGSQPTLFAEIFQRLATDVGYTDASGIGCVGVCINPNKDDSHYVWRLPWPEEIMTDLVSILDLELRRWCFKR